MSSQEPTEPDKGWRQQPSEHEAYLLEQLAELQQRMAPLTHAVSDDDADDVEPGAASAVLEQAGVVLKLVAELEQSEPTAQDADWTAELSWQLSRKPAAERGLSGGPVGPSRGQQLVMEVAESALSLGVGALLGAGLAGPYIAMALHQDVAQKVVEGVISGGVGALGGELTNLARSKRERQRSAELRRRLDRLETQVLGPEPNQPEPEPKVERGADMERTIRDFREATARFVEWMEQERQARLEPEAKPSRGHDRSPEREIGDDW